MGVTAAPETGRGSDRTQHRTAYDHDMAKRVLKGIQELRRDLKTVVDEVTSGTHVVFTRHGKTTAALVPMEWYRQAAEKMGEPTEL